MQKRAGNWERGRRYGVAGLDHKENAVQPKDRVNWERKLEAARICQRTKRRTHLFGAGYGDKACCFLSNLDEPFLHEES